MRTLPYPHTTENIFLAINDILKEYDIRNKVKFIITDNTRNIFGVGERMGITPIPCGVHSIQLAVNELTLFTDPIFDKIRQIITLLRDSGKYKQKFEEFQKFSSKKVPLELIIDYPGRWNSTLMMLQRFLQLHEMIMSFSIALSSSYEREEKQISEEISKNCLKEFELQAVGELTEVLQPFKHNSVSHYVFIISNDRKIKRCFDNL